MRTYRPKGVYLFALILIVSFIFADTLNLPIGQVMVNRSGGVNRIRVSLDVSCLRDCRVDYAEIFIPHFLDEGAITVEGWRLNSRNPDDYDTTFHARYVTDAEIKLPVILDITEFMQYWLENGNNFGILLKRPYYEGSGFRKELAALLNALRNARVRIFYIPSNVR